MPQFRIVGRFADNHTFRGSIVADDAREAIGEAQDSLSEQAKEHGGSISSVTVKLMNNKSAFSVSEKPAPKRESKRATKTGASNTGSAARKSSR